MVALQVGAMKGNLKSIPVKYVLYTRDCIFIYDHHFGNLDLFIHCSSSANIIWKYVLVRVRACLSKLKKNTQTALSIRNRN